MRFTPPSPAHSSTVIANRSYRRTFGHK